MKKIILIVSLLLLTASVVTAQVNGFSETNKNTIQFTDSLYYGTPGDSIWVVDLSGTNPYPAFFLDGNANSPVDSVGIKYGVKVYDSNGDVTDTTWGQYQFVKDSSFTAVNTMINSSRSADFQPIRTAIQLVKFILLNDRATLPTRSVRVSIVGIKIP